MNSVNETLAEKKNGNIKALIAVNMTAQEEMGKHKSGELYGVAYIAVSPTTIVKALIVGSGKGKLSLGVNIEDAARMVGKAGSFNMVFLPVLSESFKSIILKQEFPKLMDSIVEINPEFELDTPLFCCTISEFSYNKGNKTLSAIPKFLSSMHLDVFRYLSVQNDKWSSALRR